MELVDKIIKGERAAIAKAITLVESSKDTDQQISRELISELIKKPGKSIRVGFSGPPGVGKSTFIESFGSYLVSQNYKLGILAIDPSSQITGGSILGDKTRMVEISKNPNTFIRSTPSRGTLGGISMGTREASIILDAAGYDFIFIETVGVGQSEIVASNLVDIFTLIVGPGSGDELQGIKKGITEYADIFIVNKNDGELKMEASKTAADYKSALSYYKKLDALEKQVLLVSAIEQTGMEDVIKTINQIIDQNKLKGIFDERRADQLEYWIEEEVKNIIASDITKRLTSKGNIPKYSKKVMKNEMSMYEAVETITKDTLKQ
jgi:LAO/AO transport system kinase